jgi:hypothetical protein
VDATYGVEEERLETGTAPPSAASTADGSAAAASGSGSSSSLTQGGGSSGGAFIVRLPAGPVDKYLRKEALWPHVREFADNAIAHVDATLAALAAGGEACELYDIHGGKSVGGVAGA